MREEEEQQLPHFARAAGVTQQYLETLGRYFDLAKLTVPTRCVMDTHAADVSHALMSALDMCWCGCMSVACR